MARVRLVFLGVSVVGLLLVTGLLRAGLGGDEREDLFRSLGIFTEVVHLVENEYVDELNDEALSMALDAGLLESIDPWAAVVPDESLDGYRRLVANPPPFGLMIGGRLGSAAVRYALPGSPAAAAELRSWEVIEKIGAVYTRGRPLWQIRLDLARRQAAGEPVTLTVLDRHVDERREVVLTPEAWTLNPLDVSIRDGIQVVAIRGLDAGVADQVARIVKKGRPLVLDLRHLVWGIESEAVAVADVFVGEGLLAERRGRKTGEERFEAQEGPADPVPPVVLIGDETEGVGEVLASALGRHGSPLVGWNTAGHAPHMQFVHGAGLNLWIPVAQWLDADGDPITDAGLEATEEMDFVDLEQIDEDPVLERGVELALNPEGSGRASEPEAA